MHSLDLILTLAGGLGAALVAGYATHRLGMSPIVGYLFAGILVGPNTPGFVADRHLAEQLAEIGVVLLMFGVGLQFHVEELIAVRRVAIPGAIAQSAVATALGAWLATTWGWSLSSGIVFGIALSVASTVVLVRVLSDNRVLHTPAATLRSAGWSWRICSRYWCWCSCRQSLVQRPTPHRLSPSGSIESARGFTLS